MRMPEPGETPDRSASVDALLAQSIPDVADLAPELQQRLREMAADLLSRSLPVSFIKTSLRSTAEVLRDLHEDETRPDNVLQREDVRRFIEENAVPEAEQRLRFHPRRERKREERERLHANTCRLLREARQSRARHEVKKTRNMLLKVDQRELRRVLGREGDELCRQINTWLRSTAEMF
jgi:hypothetical protein